MTRNVQQLTFRKLECRNLRLTAKHCYVDWPQWRESKKNRETKVVPLEIVLFQDILEQYGEDECNGERLTISATKKQYLIVSSYFDTGQTN